MNDFLEMSGKIFHPSGKLTVDMIVYGIGAGTKT
jgi:hypothetical protein